MLNKNLIPGRRSVWTTVTVVVAFTALGVVLLRDAWVGGASLNAEELLAIGHA